MLEGEEREVGEKTEEKKRISKVSPLNVDY